MTKEEFIKKAIEKHGDVYDYSLVEYKNNKTPVTIMCKKCGTVFNPRPDNFLHGTGCPKCGREKANKCISDTKEDFIRKAIEKHGNKYDYSLVEYIKSNIKVKIKCNKCGGVFEQTPAMHLSGNGCSICNPPHKRLTHEEFIERLSKTHPNLEVLSEYNGKDRKITVRCKIHNHTYETTPHRLVQGMNCKYCYDDRRGETIKNSIDKIKNEIYKVHGDKYQYPYLENEYVTSKSKITIICPIHGEFKQSYNKHVNREQGCPICSESHYENYISKLLNNEAIKFEREKTFNWLGLQSLDFYLPVYNIGIEVQGEFHFKSFIIKNTLIDYRKQVRRDEKKKRLCDEHGVKLIYIIPSKLMKKLHVSEIYNKNDIIEINDKGELIGKSIKDIL